MGTLIQDLRYGVRKLRNDWMITLVAVISLALGIAGNATVFSLVDALLFRPLPFDSPEQVVIFGEREKSQAPLTSAFGMSIPNYRDLAERSRTTTDWAAFQSRPITLRGEDRADAVAGALVTTSFFPLLGTQTIRGRTFLPEEGIEGARKVVVLAYEFSMEQFGESADPLGEVLILDGEPHEVIGILPEDWNFIAGVTDLWVPLAIPASGGERDKRNLLAMARMGPSITMEIISAEIVTLAEGFETEYPAVQRGRTIDSYNLRYDFPSTQNKILFGLLQGSVILVLLIACANIANLLLARGQERSKEIALRTVLGAHRWRIVQQLLTEGGVMVLGGTAIGLGLAKFGIQAMAARLGAALPANYQPRLDLRVLLIAVGFAVIAAIVSSLYPALQTFKNSHSDALRGGARAGSSKRKRTVSKALVIAEIALSFVALGGGSMMVRSFLEIGGGDPGFTTDNLLTAVVSYPPAKYPTDAEKAAFADQILEAALRVPGVQSSALMSSLPQSFAAAADTFRLASDVAETDDAPRTTILKTSPDYLSTMNVGLIRGRFFDKQDGPEGAKVVVLSQSLAEREFGDESPVGQLIVQAGETRTIVGVVSNTQVQLISTAGQSNTDAIYLPAAQSRGTPFLVLRTRSDPTLAIEGLRRSLRDLDPDLALAQVQTYDEYLRLSLAGINIFNTILGGFGIMALLLASIGTYGVLAYSVGQRRREIGIRLAVGAETRSVVWIFFRQGAVLALIGLVIGFLMTLPLVGVLQSVLAGFATVESNTLWFIAAALTAVSLVASLVPAWAAAAVDPISTLREE